MRLIDADAIIKRAEESFKSAGLHGDDYRKFKKWLRKAPTVSEWIPVSERLPEEGLTVLTFDTNGDIEFGAYEDGKWEWLAESCSGYWTRNDGVIAWMPLPEPYREDGEA